MYIQGWKASSAVHGYYVTAGDTADAVSGTASCATGASCAFRFRVDRLPRCFVLSDEGNTSAPLQHARGQAGKVKSNERAGGIASPPCRLLQLLGAPALARPSQLKRRNRGCHRLESNQIRGFASGCIFKDTPSSKATVRMNFQSEWPCWPQRPRLVAKLAIRYP